MTAQMAVLFNLEHDVATITLNDPATLNAASLEMVEQLSAALSRAETEARAVLLTGAGRGFCSGANLSGTLSPDSEDYDAGEVLDTHFNPLMRQIRDLAVPLVTVVNGAAAGVGCSLALAGDLILASRNAYFLQAFRRIGLVPDGGSAWLLTRAVGRPRALEMMLLGEKIDAEQALQWGLINRVFALDALQTEALALGRSLAQGPTRALAAIRRQAWAACEHSFEGWLDVERKQQKLAGMTRDHREGVAAFLAKRPASFQGE